LPTATSTETALTGREVTDILPYKMSNETRHVWEKKMLKAFGAVTVKMFSTFRPAAAITVSDD
jgi:hypothetical protein